MASLNKLQQDKGYRTEVLHSFRWVCQVIKDILDEELNDYLLTKLEKRYIDDLSFAHMGRCVIHYYKSWFGKSPRSIL
ncbi:2068_t:CDS:2, partial [Gigaspora rosea]